MSGTRMSVVFLLFTLFIGLTSAFDAYLNLKYPVIAALEENPLACWILQEHGDGDQARAVLLALKFGGTVIVLVVLHGLFSLRRTRPWAWIAAVVLSAFQLIILFYMTGGFQFV